LATTFVAVNKLTCRKACCNSGKEASLEYFSRRLSKATIKALRVDMVSFPSIHLIVALLIPSGARAPYDYAANAVCAAIPAWLILNQQTILPLSINWRRP
jgi:hypothetical protein